MEREIEKISFRPVVYEHCMNDTLGGFDALIILLSVSIKNQISLSDPSYLITSNFRFRGSYLFQQLKL